MRGELAPFGQPHTPGFRAGRERIYMILQGNSIRIPLRDESVHCVVTSFPYYNLRSYGIPPTIWGGDSSCQHIWGSESRSAQRLRNGAGASGLGGDIRAGGENTNLATGQFCQLCSAWLGCFGLEPTISLHVQNAVLVCREIKRVLRKDGVFWLNYGDSYATGKNGRSAADTKAVGKDDRTFRDKPFSVTELPAKNSCLIPFRVALALQDDGWIVRSDLIWEKPNSMPESVTDRPSKSHEYIFMLVKSARYFYDSEAVRVTGKEWNGQAGTFNRTNGKNTQLEVPGQVRPSHRERDDRVAGGRNLRTVWTIPTESFSGAHYATFPRKLVEPMILAATSARGVCPECGKPWERVVEKGALIQGDGHTRPNNRVKIDEANLSGWSRPGGLGATQVPGASYERTTTGWQPTCKCIQKRAPNFGMKGSELLELADEVARELAPIPAIILDPFCGSGTVGAVSRELGRRFIGIDLSARYLAENALPRSEKKMSLKALGQLPMFADLDEAA